MDPDIGSSQLEDISTVIQALFPELTDLLLTLNDGMTSVVPDSFLDRFATRLQFLYLMPSHFRDCRNLSATHLVDLRPSNIPHSRYISPEAMITCFSALASLNPLYLSRVLANIWTTLSQYPSTQLLVCMWHLSAPNLPERAPSPASNHA